MALTLHRFSGRKAAPTLAANWMDMAIDHSITLVSIRHSSLGGYLPMANSYSSPKHLTTNVNTINGFIFSFSFAKEWAADLAYISHQIEQANGNRKKSWRRESVSNCLLFILSSGFNFIVRDVDVDDGTWLDNMTGCHLSCAQPTAKSTRFRHSRSLYLHFPGTGKKRKKKNKRRKTRWKNNRIRRQAGDDDSYQCKSKLTKT